MLGKANANGIGAIVENHGRRCRLALKNGRSIQSDLLGGKTNSCGHRRIDLKRHSRTADGILHTVENIYDAMHFANSFCHFWRGLVQKLAVARKELDDNRFRLAGQITYHVLQDLNKFDFCGWFLLLNLRSDVRNDVVDSTLATAFQLHGEVSPIGLRHCGKAQLQTRAPRSVLHLGCGAQNIFHMQKDAVRFGKRTPRRREVVQNKSALIHLRKQVTSEIFVTGKCEHHNHNGTDGQNPRSLQNRLHRPHVKLHDTSKKASEM